MRLQNKYPSANKETYLSIIPFISNLDPRWKKVDANNFNSHQFKAHLAFTNAIRNSLNTTKTLKKMVEDQEKKNDFVYGEEDAEEEIEVSVDD
jgi:uncharacterized protein (UPF0218 family)